MKLPAFHPLTLRINSASKNSKLLLAQLSALVYASPSPCFNTVTSSTRMKLLSDTVSAVVLYPKSKLTQPLVVAVATSYSAVIKVHSVSLNSTPVRSNGT